MSKSLIYQYEKGIKRPRFENLPLGDNGFGAVFSNGLGPQLSGNMGFLSGVPSAPFVNQNPEPSISETFSSRIKMNNLRGEPQKNYRQGMPLFLFNPKNNLDEGTFDIFAIPNLNYYLEMAYLHKIERGQLTPRGIYGDSPRQKQLEFFEGYPTTITEFSRTIFPYGIMETSLEPSEIRKKWIASTLKGEATLVTNIWGDIGVGDDLYLKVVQKENDLDSLVNFSGQRLGEATQGSYLQVVPHVDKGLAKPVRCTDFKNPGPADADFYAKEHVQQQVFHTKANGLVDWEAGAKSGSTSNLVTEFYTQGLLYKVGRVLRLETSPPCQTDINEAMRSFQGWNDLKDNHVTIEVCPHSSMWNF